MKILLLEDNPDMRQVLVTILELHGHVVMTGGHGAEGLEQLKTFTPEVIISDLQMPVMDGFTFIEQLKISDHLGQIPVVFISGNPRDQDDAMRSGAYAFLSKPFKIEEFNAVLGRLNP